MIDMIAVVNRETCGFDPRLPLHRAIGSADIIAPSFLS